MWQGSEMKKIVFNILISGYLVLFILIGEIPDGLFHIYFFDIGQGDSIFITTPSNHKILIDGGPKNNVLEKLGSAIPFFDKEIDLIVLTHPHSDHLDGLLEVIKRYEVRALLITGVYFESSGYDEFIDLLIAEGVPVFIANSNTDFRFGDVLLDIVFPLVPIAGEEMKEVNNSSIVLKVLYGKTKILLTGDLEAEAEHLLIMANDQLDADILKAGHHGSKTSSSNNFIKAISPNTAVISVGKDNTFGHPSEETLNTFEKAGIKTYRTDEKGTIEFIF